MVNGGSGDVTAEVVFVGFGFDAAAQGRDDYAGVDVKGKVVLVAPRRAGDRRVEGAPLHDRPDARRGPEGSGGASSSSTAR